jgi:hypothetical protein
MALRLAVPVWAMIVGAAPRLTVGFEVCRRDGIDAACKRSRI